MKINHKSLFMLFAWGIIAGCMCIPTGLPTNARFPTPDIQLTKPSQGSLSPTPEGQLSLLTPPASQTQLPAAHANGPWLLISTEKGLWMVNQDGSGLKEIGPNALTPSVLKDIIQPGGNQVAVITSSGDLVHKLVLNLASLPDGHLKKISDLTSPATEPPADSAPGDPAFEAIRAITERSSTAWSPDGKKLAFIGLLDGTNADLYLYDIHTAQIKRVTQDKTQDFSPSWSPDGQSLIVLGTDSFGTGAGISMSGVWSARGDGSNLTMLYKPASSGETIHGWVNNSTVLISSWNMMCGSNQLRLMDIKTLKKTVIIKDCFTDAAVGPDGNFIYSTPDAVYLYDTTANKSTLLGQSGASRIYWDQAGSVYIVQFTKTGLTTFNRSGKDAQTPPNTAVTDVAAFGAIWAWTGSNDQNPGVWISGPGLKTKQIYPNKAYFPAWDPKNNLLFFTQNQIYHAAFPDYTNPAPVGSFDESILDVKWAGLTNP